MSEIGAYAAKTHLLKLLERVEKGERFVITKHGRAVSRASSRVLRVPPASGPLFRINVASESRTLSRVRWS